LKRKFFCQNVRKGAGKERARRGEAIFDGRNRGRKEPNRKESRVKERLIRIAGPTDPEREGQTHKEGVPGIAWKSIWRKIWKRRPRDSVMSNA